jgi:hypothetical protein
VNEEDRLRDVVNGRWEPRSQLRRTIELSRSSLRNRRPLRALRQRYANHIQQFANVRRLLEEGGCPCL